MRQPKIGFVGLGFFTNHAKKFMFQKSSMRMMTALSEYEDGLRFSLRDSDVIKTQFTQPRNYSILPFLKSQGFITEEYLERKFFHYYPSDEWKELCYTVRMTEFTQRDKAAALAVDILFYLHAHPGTVVSTEMVREIGYKEGGMVCLAKEILLFEQLVRKFYVKGDNKHTHFRLTAKGRKLVADIEHVQILIKPFLDI